MNVPAVRGPPLLGSWDFFQVQKRYTFIDEGHKKYGAAFRFNVLNVRIQHPEAVEDGPQSNQTSELR